MQHPGGAADDGAAGHEVARDVGSLRGHDALHGQAGRRVHAEGLFHARVEVGELLALVPRHQARRAVGKDAPAPRVVELGAQAGQCRGVAEEVVEDGAQADGCRLGAGKGHGHGHGLDERVGHELGARLLGGEELGQEVERGLLRGRRRGQDAALGLAEAPRVRQPLGHAGPGELGNGEGGVEDAPLGELEVDGVLEEEFVEDGDLANLEGSVSLWGSARTGLQKTKLTGAR